MISFEAPLTSELPVCDERVLEQVQWSKSVSRSMRRQLRDGESDQLAKTWQADLAARQKTVLRIRRSDPCWSHLESRWSVGAFEFDQRTSDLVESLQRASAVDLGDVLQAWLAEATESPALSTVELLLATEVLSVFHGRLKGGVFWQLWKRTLAAALQQVNDCQHIDNQQLTADQRLVVLGELPWRIGLLFGSIVGARDIRRRGADEFVRQVLEYTDTDGTPFAAVWSRAVIWAAPFCRALGWSSRFGQSLWKGEAESRFQQLLAALSLALDADGQLPLQDCLDDHQEEPQVAGLDALEIFSAATKRAGLDETTPASRLLKRLRRVRSESGDSTKRVKGRSDCSRQSDWSRVVVARAQCAPATDQLTLLHHLPELQLDLTVQGQRLVTGTGQLAVEIDGQSIESDSSWECSCWNSDSDGDYVELHRQLEGIELQLYRLMFLSRKDHFLFVADCASGAGESEVALESRWPLESGWKQRTVSDSRELQLKRKKQRVRVFPLSLPQDPVLSALGGAAVDNDRLSLEAIGRSNVCCAWMMSWDPELNRAPADWRTLTVSEEQRAVSPHGSAGFRLRVGPRQWLMYRRLNQSTELQSVLGYHTGHETVLGYFDSDGEVEPLLLVDGSND